MTLIRVILKLIEQLGLTSSEELRVLINDCKEWESSCSPDSDNKAKVMYHKAHQGIGVRLLSPFIYFAALKKVKDIMTMSDETDFLD